MDSDVNRCAELLSLQGVCLAPKPQGCPLCASVFPTRKELNAHKVLAHHFVKCTARRCSKVFMSQKRWETHYARSHRAVGGKEPAPTVHSTTEAQGNQEKTKGLIGELLETTLDYLKDVKGLMMSCESLDLQRMNSLITCVLREIVDIRVCKPDICVHAIGVAVSLPVMLGAKSVDINPDSNGGECESTEDVSPVAAGKPARQRRKSPHLYQRRGPKPSTYPCTKCSRVFPYKKELQAHRYSEHPRRSRAHFPVQELPLVPPDMSSLTNCMEGGDDMEVPDWTV